MERCPRELWVINDRARVARVCLWLTRFEPQCLVTIVIGQPCSLWVTGRIPGVTRWSAGWARVNREVGVKEEEVRSAVSNGYNYTQQQRGVLVPPLLHDLRGSLLLPPSYPPHLCFQNASLGPSLAVGGTTNLLCPTTCRPAGNKFWEIIVHWLTRMSIHHQSTKHRETGLSNVHL